MKKTLIITALTILLLATGLAYTQHSDKTANYENKNFEIKIVTDYPTQGSLQALVKVDKGEKRTMVLRNDLNANLNKRCNTLYKASRKKHSNPCHLLQ